MPNAQIGDTVQTPDGKVGVVETVNFRECWVSFSFGSAWVGDSSLTKVQPCPHCHDTAWKEVTCGAGTTRTVCQSCDHPANDCYCGCEGIG